MLSGKREGNSQTEGQTDIPIYRPEDRTIDRLTDRQPCIDRQTNDMGDMPMNRLADKKTDRQ